MKNYIEAGDQLTIPAPSGGVVAGNLYIIGALVGVAGSTAAVGINFALKTLGVFELAKVSAQAWTVGQRIYYDSGAGLCTTVATGNSLIGRATEVAANPSSVGRVRLDPGGVRTPALGGTSEGLRVAAGQATTVAASDTIATGLTTLTSVVVSLDDSPGDDPEWVSASIGDQAGAPVAGSFLLKSWKNTGGTDPTPAAATTFGKKVNWIAFGT